MEPSFRMRSRQPLSLFSLPAFGRPSPLWKETGARSNDPYNPSMHRSVNLGVDPLPAPSHPGGDFRSSWLDSKRNLPRVSGHAPKKRLRPSQRNAAPDHFPRPTSTLPEKPLFRLLPACMPAGSGGLLFPLEAAPLALSLSSHGPAVDRARSGMVVQPAFRGTVATDSATVSLEQHSHPFLYGSRWRLPSFSNSSTTRNNPPPSGMQSQTCCSPAAYLIAARVWWTHLHGILVPRAPPEVRTLERQRPDNLPGQLYDPCGTPRNPSYGGLPTSTLLADPFEGRIISSSFASLEKPNRFPKRSGQNDAPERTLSMGATAQL